MSEHGVFLLNLEAYFIKLGKKVKIDFLPDSMYSNEKQNILWLTKMENNVLLVRDIPLSDFDTGADDGKTIKLENVDSSLVLLPDNKLAFVDTERRIFSISMMTGEQTPIPAQFEASARCSLLGSILVIIITPQGRFNDFDISYASTSQWAGTV